jgi:RNA recognition motif-containing protein
MTEGVSLGTELLVSNLPPSIDASALEDMFTMIGNVKSSRVEYDTETGLSKGRGYIEMCTPEEAENCILHFNGQDKLGQRLAVREDKPHVPKPAVEKKSRRAAVKKAQASVSNGIRRSRR